MRRRQSEASDRLARSRRPVKEARVVWTDPPSTVILHAPAAALHAPAAAMPGGPGRHRSSNAERSDWREPLVASMKAPVTSSIRAGGAARPAIVLTHSDRWTWHHRGAGGG